MKQLSQQDAAFFYSEKQRAPMHLCSLHVYDPSTAPGGRVTFEQFVEHVRSRLPLARLLRRKLVRVPLQLDLPYWVEDEGFDLDYHVRSIVLPPPADWDQLWSTSAHLHSQPIDLDRPPWELYFIDGLDAVEGYDPGSFGMLIKVHHSAIDGIAGIELMNALHDLEPEGRGTIVDPWRGEDQPSGTQLVAMAVGNMIEAPGRALRFLARSTPTMLPRFFDRRPSPALVASERPPTTVLNQRVTTNRVGSALVVDLAETKRVRVAVPGATVNDVLLTVVGGGLRRYLLARGELPDTSLIAGVPMSMRTAADVGTAGNKIRIMLVPLATTVEGERERLEAIARSTAESKEQSQAVEVQVMTEGAELFPGALLGVAVRANTAQSAPFITAQTGNVCVTNVPGSQVPLYLHGARMLSYYALGPVYDNTGPIHLIVSYCGKVYLSATSCREIIPDMGEYVDCLRQAWDQLVAETTEPTAKPVKRPVAKRKRSSSRARG